MQFNIHQYPQLEPGWLSNVDFWMKQQSCDWMIMIMESERCDDNKSFKTCAENAKDGYWLLSTKNCNHPTATVSQWWHFDASLQCLWASTHHSRQALKTHLTISGGIFSKTTSRQLTTAGLEEVFPSRESMVEVLIVKLLYKHSSLATRCPSHSGTSSSTARNDQSPNIERYIEV